MGPIGVQEAIVIFILALVLFGPKKLPELGRTIGKALTEFRRASSDLKASFEREMHNLERETEALKEPAHTIASALPEPGEYEYPYEDSYGSEEGYQPTSSSTVSAPEVPGAESQETSSATASPEPVAQVEGTVPRTETTVESSAETTSQHS